MNAFNLLLKETDSKSLSNVLDIGCGDGRWWQYMNVVPLSNITGIDISTEELQLSNELFETHNLDVASSAFSEKLSGKKWNLVLGNCSLEHVFHLDKALKNINEVLDDDGIFIIFVPAPLWAMKGHSQDLLNRISPRLSMCMSGAINGFFQHWHLYNHKIWEHLLESSGFRVVKAAGIGNKRSEFLFRLFLPTAFVSFLTKVITGKYLNYFLRPFIPRFIQKKYINIVKSTLDDELLPPDNENILEYIFVCKK